MNILYLIYLVDEVYHGVGPGLVEAQLVPLLLQLLSPTINQPINQFFVASLQAENSLTHLLTYITLPSVCRDIGIL